MGMAISTVLLLVRSPRILRGKLARLEKRDAIGIESAQATLGHAQPSMTARYSSKMDKLAIEAAKACG